MKLTPEFALVIEMQKLIGLHEIEELEAKVGVRL